MPARAAFLAVVSAAALAACTTADRSTEPFSPPALSIASTDLCDGTGVTVAECAALVAFYNSTNGDAWDSGIEGWGESNNPCTWEGVGCVGGSGPVWYLILPPNSNITGTLPPELGQLHGLKHLQLDINGISGPLPAELGQLTELEQLTLFANSITGAIPAELGNLTKLVDLNLAFNQLIGPIPSELGQLQQLQYLRLSFNGLTGPIPSELGDMASLVELQLDRNSLTGLIPASLGGLQSLVFLDLFENLLSGPIPPELGSLPALKRLALSTNPLGGAVPPELANLEALELLSLYDDQLSGVVPLEVAVRGEQILTCVMNENPYLTVPDIAAYRDADLNGDGFICNLPLSGDNDIGEDMADQIDELIPPLNGGQANALGSKIESAMAKAAKGNYQAAINQLGAFISQLGDMVASGALSAAQAAPLVEQAEALIAIWTEEL